MELSAIIKRRYIRKIHEDGRDNENSTLYTDISYEQEQLIDYCDMIADALIRYDTETGKEQKTDTKNEERKRQQIHMLFLDKYEALGLEKKEWPD